MHQPDSAFIKFLRSAVILSATIALPTLAICWKSIPGGGETFFDSFKKTFVSFFEEPQSKVDTDYRKSSNEKKSSEANGQLQQNKEFQGKKPTRDSQKSVEQVAHSDAKDSVVVSTAQYEAGFVRNNTDYKGKRGESSGETKNNYQISDAFSQLESTLHKQLGATSSRLETWGVQGKLYRYSCYVASPRGPQEIQKHFQAIESDPLQALKTVVAEVQRWQNGERRTAAVR